jgi:ATPase family AAA domain-containing protein 3A/B
MKNLYRELEILEKSTESEIKDEESKIQSEATEEREQESLSINKIRAIGEEAKASLVSMIEIISGHIFGAFTFVLSTDEGLNQVLFYALTLSLLVFLISMAKEGTSFLFWFFLQSLSMPRLVREWGKGKCSKNTSVILCPDDMRKLEETINLLQQRKKRNAPLRNILIHGAAGTGKSLIARTISESSCGLPYAIMSGADLSPLGSLGASELRKVIEWTAKQKFGGILVIDEAECALGKRIRKGSSSYQDNGNLDPDKIKASSYARDVLNMFLSLTGGSSGKFMLIITTSNPSAIDEAILDRCDDIIFCSVPGYRERKQILLKEMSSRFSMNQNIQEIKFLSRVFGKAPITVVDSRFNIEEAVTKLSSDCCTKGMTGRDLSSIIRSVHCAVYSSDEPLLTEKIWERVTKEMVVSIQASKLLKK